MLIPCRTDVYECRQASLLQKSDVVSGKVKANTHLIDENIELQSPRDRVHVTAQHGFPQMGLRYVVIHNRRNLRMSRYSVTPVRKES